MKHTAHAYRRNTDPVRRPRPRRKVVAVGGRVAFFADTPPDPEPSAEQERFTIVMWDEV